MVAVLNGVRLAIIGGDDRSGGAACWIKTGWVFLIFYL